MTAGTLLGGCVARGVRQVDVFPTAQGHAVKEECVETKKEQQAFCGAPLANLAQTGNQVAQDGAQWRQRAIHIVTFFDFCLDARGTNHFPSSEAGCLVLFVFYG